MTNPVTIELLNVVFACPGNTEESYERGARPLAEFYANLLGMRIVREDWFVIAHEDDPDGLRLAFGDGPIDYQPPRWPDPDYPQQMHLDITVDDLDAADQRVVQLGASKLQDKDTFRTYADPPATPSASTPPPPNPEPAPAPRSPTARPSPAPTKPTHQTNPAHSTHPMSSVGSGGLVVW
ncbi:VOC family protein [Kribbella sp. NPDC049227]|uniref:VOC family protein n=1 Tax=Kribbella sp. NPDC049227 TaxID=3364113 RepID=UPI003710EE30